MMIIAKEHILEAGSVHRPGDVFEVPDRTGHLWVSQKRADYFYQPFGRPPEEEDRISKAENTMRSGGMFTAMKSYQKPPDRQRGNHAR